jgi:hypothetical protein
LIIVLAKLIREDESSMFCGTIAPDVHPDVQVFHLLSCPGCFAQEFQARLNAGVAVKAIDADVLAQVFPSKVSYQFGNDSFQCFAV